MAARSHIRSLRTLLIGSLVALSWGACSSSETDVTGTGGTGIAGATGSAGAVGVAGSIGSGIAGNGSGIAGNGSGTAGSPPAGSAGSIGSGGNDSSGSGGSGTAGFAGSGAADGAGAGGVAGTAGTSGGGGVTGVAGTGSGGSVTGAGGGGNPGGPALSTASRMICTGLSPIVCHFGGNPGEYAVTVELGGAAAAQTQVQAEMHRLMLNPVTTAAGATQRFSFVVNVRTPEGQPVEDGSTEGTPGLDLYFYGSKGGPGDPASTGATVAPLLSGIGYAPTTSRVELFIAGDSTTCDQTDTNYAGWAQLFPPYFAYPISVANLADSGESAVSFYRSAKMWGYITANMKSGDWVIIQFGHNDTNDAAGAYHDNITSMVTEAKAKGAHPILVSPPARATFSGQTLSAQFVDGWGTVPVVMKQVATEQSVPFIDLTALTTTWYNQMGPNAWQAYHALGTDKTHTNRAGGAAIAGFVAKAIKDQNIALAMYLR